MATRLDRLVLLLDTGSTPAVRLTAAQQLGEIQKQHPGELHNLLSRVVVHLSNKEWDTRIAAGQAIEAIAKNVPPWDPPETVKIENEKSTVNEKNENKYSFDNFDITIVLQNGKPLLGSAGKEYDLDLSELDPAQRLALQHKNLRERLGLGGEFMDVDLLDDVDINGAVQSSTALKVEINAQPPPRSPVLNTDDMAGLSARERNKLKRKAKNEAKIKGKEKLRVVEVNTRKSSGELSAAVATPISPPSVKVEGDGKLDGQFDITPQPCSSKIVVESKKEGSNLPEDQSNEWPFNNVCESLFLAGKFDMVHVSAYEKFLKYRGMELDVKSNMSGSKPSIWEVRHAGMLGLKYAVAVRKDLVNNILDSIVDAVIVGLKDSDDDVRAVAASILIPIADYFVEFSANKIPEIVTVLWDCLKDLKDDLTASTASGVLDLSLKVWSCLVSHASTPGLENRLINFTSQHIGTWFSIIMTPLGTPIDRRLFFFPDGPIPMETTPITTLPSSTSSRRNSNRVQSNNNNGNAALTSGHSIDTGMLQQDFALVTIDIVLRGRVTASKGLGILMSCWSNESLETTFKDFIIAYLSSPWASNKQLAAIITEEWSRSTIEKGNFSTHTSLVQDSSLASIISNFMVSMLESSPPNFYSELVSILRRIRGECQALFNTFVSVGKVNSDIIPALPTHVIGELMNQTDISTPLFSVETAAEISTTIFDNLMTQIPGKSRKSSTEDIQSQLYDRHHRVVASIGYYTATKQKNDIIVFAAIAGAVVALQVLPSKLNPIIRSIMNSIKSEENIELQQRSAATLASLVSLCSLEDSSVRVNPNDKIVKNLCTFLCSDPTTTPELQSNRTKEGILSLQKAKEPDKSSSNGDSLGEEEKLKSQLIKRGAEIALRQFATQFGSRLFNIVPKLWVCMHSSLNTIFGHDEKEKINSTLKSNVSLGQEVIDTLQILKSLVPVIHESLHPKITELLPHIVKAIQCQYLVIRSMAARCFATIANAGIPDPPGLSEELLKHRDDERRFLSQLLDSSKLDPFEIPITIKAELRKYQQEGVNWLAFLNKYQLHDMGLGKTLQSICILASDNHIRATKYAVTKSLDCAHCPSLVVCPPTLTGHWYHEILNYTDSLKPILYSGNPKDRDRLRPKLSSYDVVIMSYDIVRNDIDDLAGIHWNYCILDEGHVIKNGKTKITKAVKSVKANHRLILSGTPIQNNVLELWSLFDFLMPGFLGTEKQFNERFGKPILASRDSKSSSKEQEAGALALEALHKQVLPFLLRRLKEDVLNDLPPKIIQDYYCELSDLQKQLYEQFAKSQAK
ncbi:17028_t:CDS:10, partial [Acaulospora colombiana]